MDVGRDLKNYKKVCIRQAELNVDNMWILQEFVFLL